MRISKHRSTAGGRSREQRLTDALKSNLLKDHKGHPTKYLPAYYNNLESADNMLEGLQTSP